MKTPITIRKEVKNSQKFILFAEDRAGEEMTLGFDSAAAAAGWPSRVRSVLQVTFFCGAGDRPEGGGDWGCAADADAAAAEASSGGGGDGAGSSAATLGAGAGSEGGSERTLSG